MLIAVLELVLMTLVVVLFVSQVGIPLWRGTPLFPAFKPERRLLRELAEIEQARIERELWKEITTKKQAIQEEASNVQGQQPGRPDAA